MADSSHALTHSRVMLRRNLRHMQRYPSLTFITIGMPVVFLLLFVYVLGGTLGNGLGGLSGAARTMGTGRSAYVNYVSPAIILLAVMAAAQGTAIAVAVAQDMTEGIIARFRTMAVSRTSVLTGHVIGATIQTVLGVAIVTGIAVAVGFRPRTSALDWLALVGVVLLLPFLGSGFVPTSSLPTAIRWFAEYEPFTPVNETLRGLLTGTRIGSDGLITIAWCVAVAALSYAWSRRLYEREPEPR